MEARISNVPEARVGLCSSSGTDISIVADLCERTTATLRHSDNLDATINNAKILTFCPQIRANYIRL